MLRDTKPISTGDAKFDSELIYSHLFNFVETTVSQFPSYFKSVYGSIKRERRITQTFAELLTEEHRNSESILRFGFTNEFETPNARSLDIGIKFYAKSRSDVFCAVEAKRLGTGTQAKQYVCGSTGGIERFKRGHHGSKLKRSIMLGYVQSNSVAHWFEYVNTVIEVQTSDASITWSSKDKLVGTDYLSTHFKCESTHARSNQTSIRLMHLWVEFR